MTNEARLEAIVNYQKKLAACMKCAEKILRTHIENRKNIIEYNNYINGIKHSLPVIYTHDKTVGCIDSVLSSLGKSSDMLNEAIVISQVKAIGKLGSSFDELRSLAGELQYLFKGNDKLTEILLASQKEIDFLCTTLLKNILPSISNFSNRISYKPE